VATSPRLSLRCKAEKLAAAVPEEQTVLCRGVSFWIAAGLGKLFRTSLADPVIDALAEAFECPFPRET